MKLFLEWKTQWWIWRERSGGGYWMKIWEWNDKCVVGEEMMCVGLFELMNWWIGLMKLSSNEVQCWNEEFDGGGYWWKINGGEWNDLWIESLEKLNEKFELVFLLLSISYYSIFLFVLSEKIVLKIEMKELFFEKNVSSLFN